MTEFMDMNDDCLEYLLTFCDAASIVVMSQTCKKLNVMSTKLFSKQTKFSCSIVSLKYEKQVWNALRHVGQYLIELNLCPYLNGMENKRHGFIAPLSQLCPNLQRLTISDCSSPNIILRNVCNLRNLVSLYIGCTNSVYTESIDCRALKRLADTSKKLESLEISGLQFDHNKVKGFVARAECLKDLRYEFNGEMVTANRKLIEGIRRRREFLQQLPTIQRMFQFEMEHYQRPFFFID